MKLQWYGHASFKLTADDGTVIVTDPYTPEVTGYPPFMDSADLVIMSSDNDRSHCRADLVPGNPSVIDALALAKNGGDTTERGIRVRSIQSMEALNHKYHDPDLNGMYRFTVDGLDIGHMGDVGNPLSPEQLDFFKGVDVLLALTGGHPTIELDDLKTVIEATGPKLIVPMHFQTLSYRPYNILWIESFLTYFDKSETKLALSNEISLNKAEMASWPKVLVLDYTRVC
jgi:L-ascorbate metabolism protein UlaG (beta-lactamase superfamily)